MPVNWHAPYGTVLDQTDQFVVAQTLYKNRFALLDIYSGELYKEVKLVREQNESPDDTRDEWNNDEIPDDILLHPSGTLELDTRPGPAGIQTLAFTGVLVPMLCLHSMPVVSAGIPDPGLARHGLLSCRQTEHQGNSAAVRF